MNVLSAPSTGIFRMRYRTHDGSEVTDAEVSEKLRSWWRERTLSEDEWKHWSRNVLVEWSLARDNEVVEILK